MSGLVLKLGPKERVLINGAVIENGDRRSRLAIVTPNANILRLRDAVRPEEAKTPVLRLCYQVQLVLAGDMSLDTARAGLLQGIEQLSHILRDNDSHDYLHQATQALIENNAYKALKNLRMLRSREERLLHYPARLQ